MSGGQCWPCSAGWCGLCTGCNCNHNLLSKQPKKVKKPKKPKSPPKTVKKKWWQ